MSDDPLWRFALGFYARPGAAPACLELQDEAGCDVTLVLWLLWCADDGRPLDAGAIAAADARLARWRDAVVVPLRATRRAMREALLPGIDTEPCRGRVKALELEAERLALAALSATAPEVSGVEADAAVRNLARYEAHLGREFPQAAVQVLVGHCGRRDG